MSLYRKYRPQKFIDLIGQEPIVNTISSALEGNNFSHAYIFSGPKGSGKTTMARLLAKALNCQGRTIGKGHFEPCEKCVSCKEITAGNNLDMIEIDAASNRGIDEIRNLRDKVRFAPTVGKYKIYIIDECHMLTREAFNALLKTLEEPPNHAVFVLATTEIHKVPATIISRTQSFEFQKGTPENILKLLEKTAKAEKIKIEDDALKLIARLSFGAFRDGLSMLDQVSSLSHGRDGIITLAETQNVLGQATEGYVWEFVEYLSGSNREKALKLVEKIYFEGKDLENFIVDVTSLLRKAILLKEGLSLNFELSKEEITKLTEITFASEVDDLVKMIEKLFGAATKVKTSVLGQLPLEMAVFEITKESRIKSSESSIDAKTAEKEKQKPEIVIEKVVPKSEPIIQKNDQVSNNSMPTNMDSNNWQEVVKIVKAHNNALAATLKDAAFSKTADHQIILAVKFKFHSEQICNKKNLVVIEGAVTKVTGEIYKIECIVDPDLKVKKPLEAEEELLNGAKEVFGVEV